MLRGIGGFEKDNTLAYSDVEETPEQRKAREHEEIESKREAEAVAASQRREDLAKILIEHRANIDAAAGELTEEDLEHIHGERELDKLDRGLCCGDRYVERELTHSKPQLRFIMKALSLPLLTYGLTTLYAIEVIHDDSLRASIYDYTPVYVSVSLACWLVLSLLGRAIRIPIFTFIMFLLRGFAFFNLLPATQLYVEYFIWEILYYEDRVDRNPTAVTEMEERLRLKIEFPESWLDLPVVNNTDELVNRQHFTRSYVGALFGFCCFFPILCIQIGLGLMSFKKHLKHHHVTGKWMPRIGGLASLIPCIVFYFLIDYYDLTYGPRVFNFLQIYSTSLLSVLFAAIVSGFWPAIFDGETCNNVRKEDFLYIGFMYTL